MSIRPRSTFVLAPAGASDRARRLLFGRFTDRRAYALRPARAQVFASAPLGRDAVRSGPRAQVPVASLTRCQNPCAENPRAGRGWTAGPLMAWDGGRSRLPPAMGPAPPRPRPMLSRPPRQAGAGGAAPAAMVTATSVDNPAPRRVWSAGCIGHDLRELRLRPRIPWPCRTVPRRARPTRVTRPAGLRGRYSSRNARAKYSDNGCAR